MTEHNTLKITDFGLATLLRESKFQQVSCGTIRYADPEILKGKQYSGELADIWSLGIILFTLVAGYLPFEDEVFGLLLKKISKSEIDFPKGISAGLKDLINRILQPNISLRASLQEIMSHSWFVEDSLVKFIKIKCRV